MKQKVFDVEQQPKRTPEPTKLKEYSLVCRECGNKVHHIFLISRKKGAKLKCDSCGKVSHWFNFKTLQKIEFSKFERFERRLKKYGRKNKGFD